MKIISQKTCLYALVAAGTMALGTLGFSASAHAEKYNAQFYVAAMGGHFAKADIEIDPSSPTPLHLKALSKIDIGDGETHPTHDARVDVNDRNKLFWSTYHVDEAAKAPHVGVSNIETGEVIKDVLAPIPEQGAKHTTHVYCASGQTKDYFLPITMTDNAYISVYRKSDLQLMHNVFLEGTEADPGVPYIFYHGATSPDMSKILISVNEAEANYGKPIGKILLMLLDANELVNGKVKMLKKAVIPGNPGATINFRSTWSNNGKMIALSGADTMYIINADDLSVMARLPMGKLEENHDAMFTPDDKYVIATSRTKTLNSGNAKKITRDQAFCKEEMAPEKLGGDDYTMDGQLKLYDVAAKKFIGQATSTCLACHNEEDVDVHAVLCGLDANFQ